MFKHDQCSRNFHEISSSIILNVDALVKKEPLGVPFFMSFTCCLSMVQCSTSQFRLCSSLFFDKTLKHNYFAPRKRRYNSHNSDWTLSFLLPFYKL